MEPFDLHGSFDLEYFFDLSPDLICIAGYDGFFRKVNAAVSSTLGYSEEELLSLPISSFVHPDDLEITLKSRESVREDNLLLNFENRYITKSGEIVWLSWTTKLIQRDSVIFAIAKNINHQRVSENRDLKLSISSQVVTNERLLIDKIWLNAFESIVKKHVGNIDLKVSLISGELAMSERQVFREVKRILGIAPNKLIRNIRLQVAFEAASSGKYTTLNEISNIAGFDTPAYFGKLFEQAYGMNVLDVINKKGLGD